MAFNIHPDPGSHHSSRFTATVGGQNATVLGFGRTTLFKTEAWNLGATVENSWLTYNANATVEVVITRLAGAITSAIVYPKNAGVTQALNAGTLVLQVPTDVRLRIEINGDKANVFHLFSDPYMSAFPAQYTNYTTLRRHVSSVDLNTEIVTTATPHDFVTGQKIIWHNEAGATAPTTSPQITEHMLLKVVKVDNTRFTLTDATTDENPITFTNAGAGGRALFPASWSDITKTLVFDTGVWPIARLFELAVDGLDVYVTGGAIVKGSFDFRLRDNCTIRGPGMISGEFSTYEVVAALPTQSARYPYSIFYGDEDAQWNHTGNTIEEVTVFATPYYTTRYGINRWDHMKIIACHTWEQDGIAFTGRSAAPHTAEAVKCYSFTSDDNVHLAEQFCQATVSGCFLINGHAACFHAGYFPYWGDTGRTTTITDCDVMHIGIVDQRADPQSNVVPGNNAIFRAWTDGLQQDLGDGPNRYTISDVRVWGTDMKCIFFSLGNVAYPYGTPNARIGEVWNWTFDGITFESAPAQKSFFTSLDAVNTPHDITFTDVYFATTKLTDANYLDFIEAYTLPFDIVYDVADVPPGAITFVVEDGSGKADAVSYISVEDANDYFANHSNPATWTDATTAQKQNALREATLALDLLWGNAWAGVKRTSEQALDWPRSNVTDPAGNLYDSFALPYRLLWATAQMALLHLSGETLLPSIETVAATISSETVTVGPISKSTSYQGGLSTGTVYPTVSKTLSTAGLIRGSGSGASWGAAQL